MGRVEGQRVGRLGVQGVGRIGGGRDRELFIDNLLVRVRFIIEMIWWTGLAPWEFEFPFPGSLISSFLAGTEGTPSTLP